MRFRTTLLILAAAASMPLIAEEKPAGENVYLVEYTLHETAPGEQAKARQYSVLLTPNSWGKIAAATKIPYLKEKDKYSYADIGVIINCQIHEKASQVTLAAKVEVSSVLDGGTLPKIQSVSSDMTAPVPLGKSTRIVILDDPTAGRHYDVDVLITRI